jgi:hypothetical protein
MTVLTRSRSNSAGKAFPPYSANPGFFILVLWRSKTASVVKRHCNCSEAELAVGKCRLASFADYTSFKKMAKTINNEKNAPVIFRINPRPNKSTGSFIGGFEICLKEMYLLLLKRLMVFFKNHKKRTPKKLNIKEP